MKVEIDRNQLGQLTASLDDLRLNGAKILARSLNKTATQARKRSDQEIRKKYMLKSSYVKSKIYVSRATYQKLSARISAQSRGVLMTRYPHKKLARGGYSVKIMRAKGETKKIKGAFLRMLKAGDRRVPALAIQDKSGEKWSTGNRKFEVMYSPSVSQSLNKVKEVIEPELADFLELATETEIATFLRGF